MILDIITDSVRYAFSKPKTVLLLGILNLFDFLIIPLIFLLGYNYRISKNSTRGIINANEKMPPFNNFKQMFIDGIKMIITILIYLTIPFIIFMILTYLSINSIPNYLVYPLANLPFIVFYCYFYIALPNMAYYDSFKKAFDFKQINRIIINKIGIIPLIILLAFLDLLEYIFENISVDIADILNTLLNFNSFSTHTITFIFGTVIITMFITPVIDIMLARSTGLLYVNDE